MTEILVLQDINFDGIDVDEKKYTLFEASKAVKPCVGCFGCWIKTPGKCIINDNDAFFATTIPHVREVVVVSQLVFGGLSPNIKAVFDRSIGFILPFFENVNGEMHHKQRYEKRPSFKYMLYSENMTQAEKETAKKLVKANMLNFGVNEYSISFYNSPQEVLEVLK